MDADDPILIEQSQQWILPRQGISASPNQIFVTVGAQQALCISASSLLNHTRTMGVEQPSHSDMRSGRGCTRGLG